MAPTSPSFLHLLWCNLAGLRCTRRVVLTGDEGEGADDIAGIGDPSLCKACITLPIHADVPAGGWIGDGSVRLRPDPSTLRPVPWIPGGRAQLALVTMVDELTGQPWSLCPRALLQRVLAGAEAQHGLAFRVGFEIEFVLADAQGHPMGTQPVLLDQVLFLALALAFARLTTNPNKHTTSSLSIPFHSKYTTHTHSALDAAMPILQEMVEAIHALGKGARVEQVHKESAPGQFEIVLGHLPALEAADQLLLAKQAIVAVSQRHGLRGGASCPR